MKQSLFSVGAVLPLVGILLVAIDLEAAGPPPVDESTLALPDGEVARPQAAGTALTPLNYATGFEAAEGFTARDATCEQNPCASGEIGDGSGGDGYTGECGFIGDGTQGSGPYPEPWGVSGSNVGNIEGHIETAHPFSGSQHLRLSQDLCDSQNPFGFAVDARVPPSPPLPGPIAPVTYSAQIAIDGLFGTNVTWYPLSNSQGLPSACMLFYFYGWFYILDEDGFGLTQVPVLTNWDASGGYRGVATHHDPCANHICINNGYGTPMGVGVGNLCPNGNSDCRECVGGDNDGAGCIGDFMCPGGGECRGGDCVGRIDYYYDVDGDGVRDLIYQGTTFAGTTAEQFLIYTDNFSGDVDVDDLVIETGDPCPNVCGNLEHELDEECDGANDRFCPGNCVPPGGTGPNGEGECTCVVGGPSCETATPMVNGPQSEFSHGGWWTFTADTTAYAVETCGTQTHDTAIYAFTGACGSLEELAFNDDCDDNTFGFGLGSDPLASCYAIGGIAPPYESCVCIPTIIGQQYWILDANAGLRREAVVTLSKRQSCDAIWEGGACCDGYGNCTEDVLAGDCADVGDVWSAQKFCSTVEPCDVTLGACCDGSPGLGGLCADGVEAASCAGANQEYSLGALCADITCDEATGACCNGVTGICAQKIEGECDVSNSGSSWSQETSCSAVTCDPTPGACCDKVNPDPLARQGICTNGVLWAACQGENLDWTKGAACAAVPCVAIFQAIPTVSEWGMVILALVLVVMAKLAFGYVRAGRASVGASG